MFIFTDILFTQIIRRKTRLIKFYIIYTGQEAINNQKEICLIYKEKYHKMCKVSKWMANLLF